MLKKVELINKGIEALDSRYRLSVILQKRAKFLNQGDTPLIENPRFKKEFFIALEELLSGKLMWKSPNGEWKSIK
jgi:DNA-directed RNA polymerase omega subunit